MFRQVVAIIRFYHSTHLRLFYTIRMAACLMKRYQHQNHTPSVEVPCSNMTATCSCFDLRIWHLIRRIQLCYWLHTHLLFRKLMPSKDVTEWLAIRPHSPELPNSNFGFIANNHLGSHQFLQSPAGILMFSFQLYEVSNVFSCCRDTLLHHFVWALL